MMKLGREEIASVVEGLIKRFSSAWYASRELFQHYGFSSRPLAGAEGIILVQGNNVIMVAEDDRRYRVALENGEVCLFTDEGDKIHFKRGKLIHIVSGNKLLADIANDVEVNTKRAKVTASESVAVTTAVLTADASTSAVVGAPIVTVKADALTVQNYSGGTPQATINGNVAINGSLVVNGNITQTGNLGVTGNINASGNIIDGGVNTNHHSHS